VIPHGRRCALATTRDENGRREEHSGSAAAYSKPISIWCFEPVREPGGTLFWHNAVPITGRRESTRRNVWVLFARPHPAAKGALFRYYSRCCGIDVHKDSVTACVLVYADGKEPEVRKKEFRTHFRALGNLRWWLFAEKGSHTWPWSPPAFTGNRSGRLWKATSN
jgi:hypothetical protein